MSGIWQGHGGDERIFMVALRSAGILDRLGSKLAPVLPRWIGRLAGKPRAPYAEAPIRPRRGFIAMLRHLPQMLRALVRTDEIWLSVLASFIGVIAGFCVVAMTLSTQWAHRVLFALGPHERLSGQAEIEPLRAILV
ncbi:MAG: hypothetical protein H7251_01550, partial [Acetobacteraceae bacterium]|nr:hypothetical protein [Acetobacteraceae bacterium]